VKALSQGMSYQPELQEWQRRDGESKFSLTKFKVGWLPDDSRILELLALETNLQELDAPFDLSLVSVLPRCSSIRILTLEMGRFSISAVDSLVDSFYVVLPLLSIRSLTLINVSDLDLSFLDLSRLTSFKTIGFRSDSVADALTKSKPKSLTNLDIVGTSRCEMLAPGLLECPSLTRLVLSDTFADADTLPVIQMLHRLPLSQLTLDVDKFTDESIECLLSFLPQLTVQNLTLGTLSPKQEQLLADALPTLPSLTSLEFNTQGYVLCEHDSSHLALFSALASSPLRSLTLNDCSFRKGIFASCLDKIPDTRLTRVSVPYISLFFDSFDPERHGPAQYRLDPDSDSSTLPAPIRTERIAIDHVSRSYVLNWSYCFVGIEDRFCCIDISASSVS
jgi:hypothetical protein